MTTAEDILRKSKAKKQSTFQPVQRRAWDYFEETTINENENKAQPTNETKKEIITTSNAEENVITKVSATEELKIDTENNIKQEINESYRENIDTPTKEGIQKKLLTLAGHQKEIMRLITSHIKSRGGAPYTVSLFPNILAMKIKAHIDVTRVSLKRLIEKNLLVRMKGEKGRNGCCKFKIREDVVKACFSLFNDSPCDINLISDENDQ
jgi:hypothetical protein